MFYLQSFLYIIFIVQKDGRKTNLEEDRKFQFYSEQPFIPVAVLFIKWKYGHPHIVSFTSAHEKM